MNFKQFLLLSEALDAKLRDMLLKGKYGENTPEQIKSAIDELEKEYEIKDGPDKPTAFKFMQTKLGLKAGESKEVPKDPFFAKYYEKLKNKQIFPEEYKTLELFKDENKELLDEMMTKLRQLISTNKITLSFDTKPKIKFKNEVLDDYNDFNQFMSIIHSIEGQLADVNIDKYQNPALLEMQSKADLVAKGNNIWVFKGDDPLKCRIMGKGQVWCISSSTSVGNYFTYRHDYGQTQYFIFDFNKAPNDPARYVNPGVAPEGEYSEWVDRTNTHPIDPDGVAFGINGYNSLKQYLAYLRSKGVNTSVFKADPITDHEKKLKEFINKSDFEGAKNFPDKRKTKDGIPYMFYFYLKIAKYLTDDQFNSLSNIEKNEFLLGKENITEDQYKHIMNQGIKFFKEYINSIDNISKLLYYAEDRDEMAKLIIQSKKELTDSNNIDNLLKYAKNKDEIAKLILQSKKELTDKNVSELLYYAKNKDEIIELILQSKKELTDSNVSDLFRHATNKDEMAKIILQSKKELTDRNVSDLLQYATNKDEMAKLILQRQKELTDENVSHLLYYATNKDEMANIILQRQKELTDRNVSGLLQYATNKEEMAKIILQRQKELTDKNVYSLLQYATNKDEISKLIIQHKKELTDSSINYFISYAKNPDEMAKIILQRQKELTNQNVSDLLQYAEDKDEMINKILQHKKELTDYNVSKLLLYATNKDEMINKILQHKKELTDQNVSDLLYHAKNKDEIAKLIIQHKKELTDNNVSDLLQRAEDKDEMANIILQRQKELTDEDVSHLLLYAGDKDEMINKILQRQKELTDSNIYNLLQYATNPDEMINKILQHKKELPREILIYLLSKYATKKQKLKEFIIENDMVYDLAKIYGKILAELSKDNDSFDNRKIFKFLQDYDFLQDADEEWYCTAIVAAIKNGLYVQSSNIKSLAYMLPLDAVQKCFDKNKKSKVLSKDELTRFKNTITIIKRYMGQYATREPSRKSVLYGMQDKLSGIKSKYENYMPKKH